MGYYIEYAEHKREDKTLLAVFIELHDSLGLNRSERKRVARGSPVEIALQLFFSQNSNHFFAVDWYRDFVPSLQEFKIMSIVSLEKPFICNFSQIQDK